MLQANGLANQTVEYERILERIKVVQKEYSDYLKNEVLNIFPNKVDAFHPMRSKELKELIEKSEHISKVGDKLLEKYRPMTESEIVFYAKEKLKGKYPEYKIETTVYNYMIKFAESKTSIAMIHMEEFVEDFASISGLDKNESVAPEDKYLLGCDGTKRMKQMFKNIVEDKSYISSNQTKYVHPNRLTPPPLPQVRRGRPLRVLRYRPWNQQQQEQTY